MPRGRSKELRYRDPSVQYTRYSPGSKLARGSIGVGVGGGGDGVQEIAVAVGSTRSGGDVGGSGNGVQEIVGEIVSIGLDIAVGGRFVITEGVASASAEATCGGVAEVPFVHAGSKPK